jgi:hypothetical protein
MHNRILEFPETVVDEGVRGLKDIIREVADLEGESAPNGDKKIQMQERPWTSYVNP